MYWEFAGLASVEQRESERSFPDMSLRHSQRSRARPKGAKTRLRDLALWPPQVEGHLDNFQVPRIHRLSVSGTRVDRLLDQYDRHIVESKPKGNCDSVVAVESAEVLIETELERNEDAPNPDVFAQSIQMTGSIDESRADDFAVHRAIPDDQSGGKPGDHRIHGPIMRSTGY